LIWFKQFIYL